MNTRMLYKNDVFFIHSNFFFSRKEKMWEDQSVCKPQQTNHFSIIFMRFLLIFIWKGQGHILSHFQLLQ